MGIYTSNRYFGEAYDYASEIPMNEAYDAAFGCAHILADCQRNDMAIFESSIFGDIAEVRSIQEGYGYVNENDSSYVFYSFDPSKDVMADERIELLIETVEYKNSSKRGTYESTITMKVTVRT